MPELPDVVVYIERLQALVCGEPLQRVRLASPFLVRTYDPPIASVAGRRVLALRRIGKRIVFELEGEIFVALHLMISGRLRLRAPGAAIPKKVGLAAFDFPRHSFLLTEAATKKRASLHVVRGEDALKALDRGGLEVLESTQEEFAERLLRENRTLKRAMTDPTILSGIGNAYSDEILFAAGLSPVKRTQQLDEDELRRLHGATRETLLSWVERLRAEAGEFPEKVTAFREQMAVHGRYREPCRVCGTRVQRIRYEANEVNYCPRCQTGGKVLADRSLSRLLKGDWPRSIEELEELESRKAPPPPTKGR